TCALPILARATVGPKAIRSRELPQEVAARIEEADEPELLERRRLEAPERRRDFELPPARFACLPHGVRLGPTGEYAAQDQLGVRVGLFIDAEVRDDRRHTPARRGHVGDLVH